MLSISSRSGNNEKTECELSSVKGYFFERKKMTNFLLKLLRISLWYAGWRPRRYFRCSLSVKLNIMFYLCNLTSYSDCIILKLGYKQVSIALKHSRGIFRGHDFFKNDDSVVINLT